MRKSGVFSNVLFLSILMAGIYGIVHDQITATIAREYFTCFKFPQFHIDPAIAFRKGVAFVGFYATWWMGMVIGLLLGATGLLFPDHKNMHRYTFRALGLVLLITVTTGVIGFLYGKLYLVHHEPRWYFPAGLTDKSNFIIAGSIHNAGYIGAISGMVAGIIYLLLKRHGRDAACCVSTVPF